MGRPRQGRGARKIWLSQTGHVDPFDYRRAQWVDTLHRWFDHELRGYDNGIDRAPMADVERTPDHWTTDTVWPPRAAASVTLSPGRGAKEGVDTLGTSLGTGTATFTDDQGHSELDWAEQAAASTSDKVGFLTQPLGKALHLTGSPELTVTATPTTPTASLSAVLVDIGPATIRQYGSGGLGITTLVGRTCWGGSTTADSACYKRTEADTTHVTSTVFSRGWAALGTCADAHKVAALVPGQPCTLTLDLAATDHVVPAGHRLALIIAGTDRGFAQRAADRPTITLDLARTSLRAAAVGGSKALTAALG